MPAPPTRSPRRPYDSGYDRALRWALLGSLAAHLLLVLLSPTVIRLGPPPGDGDIAAVARPDRVVQMVTPRVADGAESPTRPPAEVLARDAAVSRAIIPVVGARPAEPGRAPAPAGTASEAERREALREALRPGYRDSRLWVAPNPLRVEEQLSQHERYMQHLDARVAAINDSIAGEAERERRAKDWTVKDKNGKRWGLSPEGLHLGGVTLPPELVPVPRATGDNQSLEAERERRRQREEIQRQEDQRARDRAREEAVKATRARKEAEKKGGGGGES